MRFRSLTRRRDIGANSYVLDTGEARILIDAGMDPKGEGAAATPNFTIIRDGELDAIMLSHAHHDHIGAIPLAQQRNPGRLVYMTEATGELGSAMLHNSVNVMTKQRDELDLVEYPLFTHKDLDELKRLWTYRGLRRAFPVAGTGIEATFYDAGHIAGSVGMLLKAEGGTVFYTGDVNFEHQTLSMAADFPTEGIDVLIMETTRGSYERPAEYSRKAEKERLGAAIRETFAAGGAVLIPVFALGKTQEVMLMLHELHQLDLIPEMPLIVGGLSTKITILHDELCAKTRRNYAGFSLQDDIEILVAPRKKRREITYQPRCIFALSSGMMTENTTSNMFARGFLENPRNTVCFVGYTDPDSPGYRVRHAKTGEKVILDKRMPPVEVNSRIESFDFSAHAHRESLLDYVLKVKPKKVLLVHGDDAAQGWFAAQIARALPDTEILQPMPEQEITLW